MRPARRPIRLGFVAPLLLVLPLGGCGGGSASATLGTTVPVKGQVTYKGKPLAGGNLTFEPEDGGREASGGIEADGSYTLSTFRQGDGAVLGVHRVAIQNAVLPGSRRGIPVKYRSLGSSGIEVEVTREKSSYPIELD
jgi:hypothetical protein